MNKPMNSAVVRKFFCEARWKGVRFNFNWEAVDQETAARGSFIRAIDVIRATYQGFVTAPFLTVVREMEFEITELGPERIVSVKHPTVMSDRAGTLSIQT